MAVPTLPEPAAQVAALGNQVAQLRGVITAQQAIIDVLKADKKDGAWSGLPDRRQMLPEKVIDKKDWMEWADSYMDCIWEMQPAVHAQLEKATSYPDIIEPTYPNAAGKKLAKDVYKTNNKSIREPDCKQLVGGFKSSHNIYELWRLLWFTYKLEIWCDRDGGNSCHDQPADYQSCS